MEEDGQQRTGGERATNGESTAGPSSCLLPAGDRGWRASWQLAAGTRRTVCVQCAYRGRQPALCGQYTDALCRCRARWERARLPVLDEARSSHDFVHIKKEKEKCRPDFRPGENYQTWHLSSPATLQPAVALPAGRRGQTARLGRRGSRRHRGCRRHRHMRHSVYGAYGAYGANAAYGAIQCGSGGETRYVRADGGLRYDEGRLVMAQWNIVDYRRAKKAQGTRDTAENRQPQRPTVNKTPVSPPSSPLPAGRGSRIAFCPLCWRSLPKPAAGLNSFSSRRRPSAGLVLGTDDFPQRRQISPPSPLCMVDLSR